MQRDVRPHKPKPPFTFHQKPKETLRSFKAHTHTRALTSQTDDRAPGNLLTVRVPDQIWKDFIQITKLHFNTQVSLYKLLTRHGELRGCGPKLK